MSHLYTSQTYVDASRRLDQACDWLTSIGVQHSNTRLGQYRRLFADLATSQETRTLDDFYTRYSFADWVNAAHEAAEVVRIYEGFRAVSNPGLVSRLRESLRGHELFVLDNDDRSGRDFTFELTIAAKFARNRYPIDFGSDADVESVVNETPFFVECKRLKSERQIEKRIKEGLKQLRKRYDASAHPSSARGLLALSIGKTVNSTLGLLEGANDRDIGTRAFLHNAAFIEKYRHRWQTKGDPRTLGVLIVLDSPGVLTAEKKLVTVHEVALNNCIPESSSDYPLLLKVARDVFAKRD